MANTTKETSSKATGTGNATASVATTKDKPAPEEPAPPAPPATTSPSSVAAEPPTQVDGPIPLAPINTAPDTTKPLPSDPSPWVGKTAYKVGDRRTYRGNLFLCVRAGTSSDVGGPVTTHGTDIVDGSARWDWVASYPTP